MESMIFTPPLRIVLTEQCNGLCQFCHNEGNQSCSRSMPAETIDECIQSVVDLQIPKIALTGGEPTIREDLNAIISKLQDKTKASIGLITNGFSLSTVCEKMKRPIDNLNLSISSFDRSIAARYQRVNPTEALKSFIDFPAVNKNLNIVITKDNYNEIDLFIEWCVNNKVSLDLLFLSDDDFEYHEIERSIFNKLLNISCATISLISTPVINIQLTRDSVLRIKHPFLSGLFYNSICNSCTDRSTCFEKVCAVRVHPNGVVTPCLTQKIVQSGNNVYERIVNTYDALGTMTFREEFFQ